MIERGYARKAGVLVPGFPLYWIEIPSSRLPELMIEFLLDSRCCNYGPL
jgi:hypothetical protein